MYTPQKKNELFEGIIYIEIGIDLVGAAIIFDFDCDFDIDFERAFKRQQGLGK